MTVRKQWAYAYAETVRVGTMNCTACGKPITPAAGTVATRVGSSELMSSEPVAGLPSEPGWYLARMKTRAARDGREIVKVTAIDPRNLQAWQPGDTRPWPLEGFDWYERVYP